MFGPPPEKASWNGPLEKRLRRSANRKLKQRRAARSLLRAPDLRAMGHTAWGGARRAAPALLGVAVIGALGAGVWATWRWATHSPRFAVREVAVAGNTRVTREEVLAAMGDPRGENVFRVSTDALAAGVEGLTWVASAEVTRALPDGLRVSVRERVPAALVVADGAYLVDAAGRPFRKAAVEDGDGEGLVVVTGVPRELWNRDGEAAARLVVDALEVVARWQEAGGGAAASTARPPVGEVNVSKHGFTLYTLEGAAAVRLGRARGEELAAALGRFDAVWSALSDEERAQAKTFWLDSATRRDRVTVELADAR